MGLRPPWVVHKRRSCFLLQCTEEYLASSFTLITQYTCLRCKKGKEQDCPLLLTQAKKFFKILVRLLIPITQSPNLINMILVYRTMFEAGNISPLMCSLQPMKQMVVFDILRVRLFLQPILLVKIPHTEFCITNH